MTIVNAAAYDFMVVAHVGTTAQNDMLEQPINIAPYSDDYFNSFMIISSTLAALRKAEATGKRESVDLVVYETPLRVDTCYTIDYLSAGITYPRPGTCRQNLCAIGEYACEGGYIGPHVYDATQNKYLLETVGLGDL